MARKRNVPDARHEQIKFALKMQNILLSDIAKELGVTRALVSGALLGRFRSRRVEAAIACHLGREPKDIWPERYVSDEEKSQ